MGWVGALVASRIDMMKDFVAKIIVLSVNNFSVIFLPYSICCRILTWKFEQLKKHDSLKRRSES